ncbi:hypothetical protein [Actinoplanes couchii]|uniref:hypothetical protein n=1 Tax=Actinoplanes couchii TaxID=403638 RepID=UPI001940BC41|nr:hypothetical protein [Actinoplanes couchii]MDR6318555.1 hypothetical protein [Actinoplanes couchii]
MSTSALAGCAFRDGKEYCSLSEKLNELPILEVRPEASTQTESSYACSSFDGYAYASRGYRSGITRTEIVTFYEKALVEDGWKSSPNSAVPPGTTRPATGINCFFTKVDDQFVQFFIDSSGAETDEYTVQVTGPGDNGWSDNCTPEQP